MHDNSLLSLNEFLDHSLANAGFSLLLQLQSKWLSGVEINHENVGSVWPCTEDQKLGEKPPILSLLLNEETKKNKMHYFCHFSIGVLFLFCLLNLNALS